MCKNEIDFLIYCIEIYKSQKKLSGKEVLDLFDTYGVTEYIVDCYEILHIEGSQATISRIDDFLAIQKQKESA
ncbi:hypothetical protein AGMMS4952_05720 [Spirochaetia bacterium]|nr:hypothetical protein FACS1894110_12550 [Spirochaetia bacterium]GHU40472.1 hypothetical protein FACS1894190_07410 [Spirochaetia bacterium]GHV23372.1 hypothetical protein FACS189494_11310 [Spirochaetia bacterium]GHV26194.1 hypothetical protein AGMMS4952_05720 [Spirochaetia bacterium]